MDECWTNLCHALRRLEITKQVPSVPDPEIKWKSILKYYYTVLEKGLKEKLDEP